jgi:ribosomal protein S18 acetylase RimI-like enzyme
VSIEVRPAGSDDIAAIVATDSYAQVNPERRAAIAMWVEAGQCFIAERDGEAVGYCVLTKNFFHSFFIEMLMVAEAERRTGVATAMIEHLVGLIPPGEKLWTSTNESNAPMRALLPRLGFVPSGRIDNLDEGDPELVFALLTSA